MVETRIGRDGRRLVLVRQWIDAELAARFQALLRARYRGSGRVALEEAIALLVAEGDDDASA